MYVYWSFPGQFGVAPVSSCPAGSIAATQSWDFLSVSPLHFLLHNYLVSHPFLVGNLPPYSLPVYWGPFDSKDEAKASVDKYLYLVCYLLGHPPRNCKWKFLDWQLLLWNLTIYFSLDHKPWSHKRIWTNWNILILSTPIPLSLWLTLLTTLISDSLLVVNAVKNLTMTRTLTLSLVKNSLRC